MVNINWKENRKKKPRVVPAFTIQALQKNTIVEEPPIFGIFKPCYPKPSTFRKFYQRSAIPIVLVRNGVGTKIRWLEKIEDLDYHNYLPLLFDGLTETEFPYKLLVEFGISEMLENGGSKVLPVLPRLIYPTKKALNTKIPEIVRNTMLTLQKLVKSGDRIGEALVPYFRQILPVPNLFINKKVHMGDKIDYSQQKGENLADIIQETLEVLEKYGGKDAFINIKYMVPIYESCVATGYE